MASLDDIVKQQKLTNERLGCLCWLVALPWIVSLIVYIAVSSYRAYDEPPTPPKHILMKAPTMGTQRASTPSTPYGPPGP